MSQKLPRPLKLIFCVENLQIICFYCKQQPPKKKIWKKYIYSFFNFILGPQNGHNSFWPGRRKKIVVLSFSLFVLFYKIK